MDKILGYQIFFFIINTFKQHYYSVRVFPLVEIKDVNQSDRHQNQDIIKNYTYIYFAYFTRH